MSEDIIQEALRAHLVADPDVTALVGQRIYADEIPQNAPHPAIAIYRVGRSEVHSKSGRANLITSTMQLTIASTKKTEVRQVADAVRDALIPQGGFCGPMGTGQWQIEVQAVETDGELDLFDQVAGIYYRHCDYSITHRYKG